MTESYVSRAALVAGILWGLVAGGVITLWMLVVFRHHMSDTTRLALTATAFLVGVLAIVAQVRCYTCRMASLVRAVGGLDETERPGLRSVR